MAGSQFNNRQKDISRVLREKRSQLKGIDLGKKIKALPSAKKKQSPHF